MDFNSAMVQLKDPCLVKTYAPGLIFQFRYGAIKSFPVHCNPISY